MLRKMVQSREVEALSETPIQALVGAELGDCASASMSLTVSVSPIVLVSKTLSSNVGQSLSGLLVRCARSQ